METTEETIDWSQSNRTYQSGTNNTQTTTITEEPSFNIKMPSSNQIIIGLLVVIIILLVIRIVQDR